jgi:nucleoid-associated protein YgaU
MVMRDQRTARFPTSEPEPEPSPDFEYEYEDEPRGGRVLWGRMAFFAGALLLAFLIGRMSAPGGISEARFERAGDRLEAANDQIDALQDRVNGLEQELAAARAQEDEEQPEASTEPEAEEEQDGTQEARTYEVKSGDTLSTIAERFYGNTGYANLIAQANGITDPAELHVGTELTIPPEPES